MIPFFASNYVPEYNQEDGSCRIGGCMDSDSAIFNVAATFNVPSLCDEAQEREASLTFRSVNVRNVKLSGTDDYDPDAINYWQHATSGADCIYNKLGCTDSGASNYL